MNMRKRTLGAACATCTLTLAGCDVFNEALERRIVDTKDASSELFQLANSCSLAKLPRAEGSVEPLTLSVSGLTSDTAESGECSIARGVLSGADGFFQIAAKKGERWHFHLDPAPGQDLAVYAARSCDLRTCEAAADVCGVGESEHFTFVAEDDGNYVVVVEGIDASDPQPLTLLAINPVCGDGEKMHGEVCDDGNQESGDGCDSACRVELADNTVDEVEPNDDSFLANVLAPPSLDEPIVVRGRIAGNSCQPDYFLLRVPEASVLDAELLTGGGTACTDAPAIELHVFGADRDELRETVRLRSGQGSPCPSVRDFAVTAGSYFIQLKRAEVAEQFEYQLKLTLRPPAGE
jgi:cysteine-rich repeat protein